MSSLLSPSFFYHSSALLFPFLSLLCSSLIFSTTPLFPYPPFYHFSGLFSFLLLLSSFALLSSLLSSPRLYDSSALLFSTTPLFSPPLFYRSSIPLSSLLSLPRSPLRVLRPACFPRPAEYVAHSNTKKVSASLNATGKWPVYAT